MNMVGKLKGQVASIEGKIAQAEEVLRDENKQATRAGFEAEASEEAAGYSERSLQDDVQKREHDRGAFANGALLQGELKVHARKGEAGFPDVEKQRKKNLVNSEICLRMRKYGHDTIN